MSISLLFIVIALVCFGVAAVFSPAKVNLIACGLFFLTLLLLIGKGTL
jgi:hypothetical protein